VILFSLDLALLRALYAGDWPSSGVMAVVALSFLGSGWMMFGFLPGLGMRALRTQVLVAIVTLALTSATVTTVKALTGRVRPCNALSWAHALSVDMPTDGSFPSGHAAGSFAFAFLVWSSNRRAGWIVIALASLVAASRVALGVHYPSDVIAGAALGAAFGLAGTRVYRSRFTPEGTYRAPESISSRG
jgi:undecaprenyl-diphosphatase